MTKTLNLQYQKSHCNWIRENEPDIWAKTKKYVLLSAYLNYRLTGRLADSTASIVGYVPYDFKNRCWKKKNDLVRPVFDIPNEMMCELVDPGDYIGSLTETAAEDLGLNKNLKLIATGTDKACEILGLGCVNKKGRLSALEPQLLLRLPLLIIWNRKRLYRPMILSFPGIILRK